MNPPATPDELAGHQLAGVMPMAARPNQWLTMQAVGAMVTGTTSEGGRDER